MNILLCCAAGMSSSLIVTKMEKAAEARGIEVKIWAVSGSEVNSHIDKADVL
ncbi:PTS sugar transporter subunit IIB, partial [Vibrio cholerae]|nr:PTS sugar transporter subunit IIB [Vibrio cholerae]